MSKKTKAAKLAARQAANLAAKKNTATKVETTAPKAEVKESTTESTLPPGPEQPVVEQPKAETKKEEKATTTAKSKAEKPKVEKPKVKVTPNAEKVETVVAEEVKPVETKKEETTKVEDPQVENDVNIGKGMLKAAGNDRISHDSGITLLKMFEDNFINDETVPENTRIASKQMFKGLLMTDILIYCAQVENDLQSFGAKVNMETYKQLQAEAQSLWGIQLKALPDKKDPKQMNIDFTGSEIPKDAKEAAKADLKARTEVAEIPEPNKDMTKEEKLTVIRAILAQSTSNKSVFAKINQAVEWARVAFEMNDAVPAQILAFIMQELGDTYSSALDGVTSAMAGTLRSESTILSSHALLKAWNPSADDKSISQLVKVFISRHLEKQAKSWNEKAYYSRKAVPETTVDNNLVIINRNIKFGLEKQVLEGVLKQTPKIEVNDEDNKPYCTVNGANVYKKMLAAYQSDSIVKDKIAEICNLYTKPVGRLANYVDKSAYAD
jgi:hypothetical protein